VAYGAPREQQNFPPIAGPSTSAQHPHPQQQLAGPSRLTIQELDDNPGFNRHFFLGQSAQAGANGPIHQQRHGLALQNFPPEGDVFGGGPIAGPSTLAQQPHPQQRVANLQN
jgi:hypothetical protein